VLAVPSRVTIFVALRSQASAESVDRTVAVVLEALIDCASSALILLSPFIKGAWFTTIQLVVPVATIETYPKG